MTDGSVRTHRLWDTRPRAVVFDCDGLLVDTEPCWTVAETEIFARRGMAFGRAQKDLLIGRTIPAACAQLAAVFGEPDSGPRLERELLDLVTEVIASSAVAMAGALAVVEAAAAKGPVAVASNSPRTLLESTLQRSGLKRWFPIALAAEDVENPKPAPDMYLAAAARLGVHPTSCVAFEDSNTGARSARAAGMPCVGVPSLPGAELEVDLILDSLDDTDLLRWLTKW